MTVTFGEHLDIELYGTSHGPCVGVSISGMPAGISFDRDILQDFLERRAPGRNAWSTARKEADRPVFLSGVTEGEGQRLITTGEVLKAEIRNTNTRPQDYQKTSIVPRPAHADYPAWVKYGKIESGGGQFSARLTAALCIAGGILLQWLQEKGIRIGAHIYSIGAVKDTPFDPAGSNTGGEDPFVAVGNEFPVIDADRGEAMKSLIAGVKGDGDSIGGIIECMICGLPAGVGSPLFGSIESRICQSVFAVPAVKGVEFGAGFAAAGMLGSENNDPYRISGDKVITVTNNHGGILGGLSSGMPQQSVDLQTMTETTLEIQGRHDPCIVPRAVPCIEAAAAVAIADLLMEQEFDQPNGGEDSSGGDDLPKFRVEIDRIDREVISLLEARCDVVTKVGEYKKRRGLPVLDVSREQQKLDRLQQLCTEEKREYIEGILKEIMAQSRAYQNAYITDGQGADMLGARTPDSAPVYGLLGRVLGHSHSPQVHKMLAGYEYGLFEREPDQLDDFFADPFWKGISVTMPYKRDVMAYCDELSPRAKACHSVNAIVRRPAENGGWTVYGDNTDYTGFRYTVESSGIDIRGCKALVLGSGGVSGTVVRVLEDLGADPVVVISRTGENNYNNLDRHRDAQIIVNTTPVGMFPKGGEAAIDISGFPQCRGVFDLIYNPLRTKLMLDAEAAGIPAFGGLLMLVAQAAAAAELFLETDRENSEKPLGIMERTDQVFHKLQQQLEDIVLIGMPGAGKTSVGQEVAEATGRRFIDLDEEITRQTGRSPEEIIREDGVDHFREIETQTLKELVRRKKTKENAGGAAPLVIACGGGIVEREENRDLLRENGEVIWIQRPLEDLPINGRPVSQKDGVEEIYRRRADRYKSWSDLAADASGITEKAAQILQKLGLMEMQNGEE